MKTIGYQLLKLLAQPSHYPSQRTVQFYHSPYYREPVDRQLKKKTFTPQRIAIGLAIVAFLVFAVNTILNGGESNLNVEREKITVSKVERGVFDEFIVVTGVVQPLKTY